MNHKWRMHIGEGPVEQFSSYYWESFGLFPQFDGQRFLGYKLVCQDSDLAEDLAWWDPEEIVNGLPPLDLAWGMLQDIVQIKAAFWANALKDMG